MCERFHRSHLITTRTAIIRQPLGRCLCSRTRMNSEQESKTISLRLKLRVPITSAFNFQTKINQRPQKHQQLHHIKTLAGVRRKYLKSSQKSKTVTSKQALPIQATHRSESILNSRKTKKTTWYTPLNLTISNAWQAQITEHTTNTKTEK